jgi:hypothetical protein
VSEKAFIIVSEKAAEPLKQLAFVTGSLEMRRLVTIQAAVDPEHFESRLVFDHGDCELHVRIFLVEDPGILVESIHGSNYPTGSRPQSVGCEDTSPMTAPGGAQEIFLRDRWSSWNRRYRIRFQSGYKSAKNK